MSAAEDAYTLLAEKHGFGESERYIRVLKFLMTPQQADIVARLPGSPEEMAKEVGLGPAIVNQELAELYKKGEIQKRKYSGWYCVPDERFWTEKDLTEGNCPDCGRPVEHIEEENYFFLMSKYQERLIDHIEQNPDYIMPFTRKNEVLGFLKNNKLPT